MVAVKTLWVLWKSFSTNFSFSSSSNSTNSSNNSKGSSDKNGNKDTKRVKYNRLRAIEKSESSYFPCKNPNRSNSNSMTKSQSAYDTNGNHPNIPGNSNWNKCTLDNSDSEYEDNNEEFCMSTTPDEFSDFEDEDEALTCDVCDRSFSTVKRLADHQQKKRHYGCLQCDSIFPSKQALDHHRQEMDHYDFVSDYESETTSFESDEEGLEDHTEERERLL